jgi:PST family polysaccharide transporter
VPRDLVAGQWRNLLRLGVAFTIASLVANLAQLAVRSLLQQSLGEVALGNFQAAAQISMTYLGFVLSAMGTDYYPRLTSVIRDSPKANQMINQQTEIAVLLGGVMLLGMMTCAPWIIQILYSKGFNEAPEILRWHILGDLFKILSWPLGFILLAAGDGRKFFVTEMVAYGTFVILVWVGIPIWGVQASGIAFFSMYIAYAPLVYYLGRRRTGLKWSSGTLREATILFALLVIIFCLSELAELYSFIAGVFATCSWGAYAYRQLHHMGVFQHSFFKKR